MVDPRTDALELTLSRHSEWCTAFAAERNRIRRALRTDGLTNTLVRIAHVGSTAVPNLVAKDVVDVVVADGAVADVSRTLEAALGGSRYENSDGWHPIFRTHDGQRFNLHVFAHSNPKWRVSVVTRDVLRTSSDRRDEYESLKRTLAAEHDDLTTIRSERPSSSDNCCESPAKKRVWRSVSTYRRCERRRHRRHGVTTPRQYSVARASTSRGRISKRRFDDSDTTPSLVVASLTRTAEERKCRSVSSSGDFGTPSGPRVQRG